MCNVCVSKMYLFFFCRLGFHFLLLSVFYGCDFSRKCLLRFLCASKDTLNSDGRSRNLSQLYEIDQRRYFHQIESSDNVLENQTYIKTGRASS